MDDVDTVLTFVPVDDDVTPVHLKDIQVRQAKDRDLRQRSRQTQITQKTKIVTYKNRIYVPKDLLARVLKWYHYHLCHPGEAMIHKVTVSTLY